MNVHAFPLFLGALAVAYLVPGPDMIFVLQTSAVRGRSQGLAATVGLGMARACHVLLAAVGLAALLRTAPWCFAIIRTAGSAYLIWLGIAVLRARSLVPHADGERIEERRPDPRIVIRGFLTNLLNPKPLLFCSVLLPQFVHPQFGSVLWQFGRLGAVLVTTGFLFDAMFALWGSILGSWLAERPRVQTCQRYGFGTVLIGFGLDLVAMRAPR